MNTLTHRRTIQHTRYEGLDLYHHEPKSWRWVDTATDSVVGMPYKTKIEALCDLERYATEYGCAGTVQPSAIA